MFIKQLKHAPALQYLTLGSVKHFNYKMLDLLHENTPNLKHLDLTCIYYLFVEEGHSLEEHHRLRMGTSVAHNLSSFSVNFKPNSLEPLPNNREINIMYWIEYIYRKYPRLTSVTVQDDTILELQHYMDIMRDYLKKALCNWKQLESFGMQPFYLSKDILQTMDDCNIQLKEVKVYVHNDMDMEQFIYLARSKQGKAINKLSIKGKTEAWRTKGNLLCSYNHWIKQLSIERN
jgi:hypothetical protein